MTRSIRRIRWSFPQPIVDVVCTVVTADGFAVPKGYPLREDALQAHAVARGVNAWDETDVQQLLDVHYPLG